MGQGIGFKCSKCGKEYAACPGIGFLFPEQYKEIQAAAKKGKFGPEWKELVNSGKYIAVDAETYLYVCGKCDYWTVEEGLSVYEPNDPEALANKQYGIKTVEEWGEVPYATMMDFKEEYHILKRRTHKCIKCGSVMHKASREEESRLKCPDCGGEPEADYLGIINWD